MIIWWYDDAILLCNGTKEYAETEMIHDKWYMIHETKHTLLEYYSFSEWLIMILQDNEVEYSTIMNIGGNLDVRDVIFQGNSNRVRNTKDSITSRDIGLSNQ